jgi:acyl-CoA synthetase
VEVRVWDDATIARYHASGFWDPTTLAEHVAGHAHRQPDGLAYVDADVRLTWAGYEDRSAQLAAVLRELVDLHEPVAVVLPDSAAVHVAFLAVERAGLVTVAVGARAGTKEIAHMLEATGATVVVSGATHGDGDAATLVRDLAGRLGRPLTHIVLTHDALGLAVVVDGDAVALPSPDDARAAIAGRALGADDLFLVNATSGTTGLPKCVTHTQNRWKYFHSRARHFQPDDRFLVVVPAPFGFGLWMAHFSPTLLGATTVVTSSFDADETIRIIERERITVLAAVTSQVVMMLSAPSLATADLSSLRVAQTGGERVPYARAAQFEDATGAMILQFYGSNEAGCVSGTTPDDPRERRLRSAGRVLPEMHVRLFADDGTDVTASGGPGQCGCLGPAITPGYLGGPDVNAKLFRPDGTLLLGDIVEVDADGYLSVIGRTADFVIRGGHNISAPVVEEEVGRHPRVAIAAAVGVEDDVLGERVCVFVVSRDGGDLDLDDLTTFLEGEGVAKQMWPEAVVNVSSLPRGAGGKVAKAELRRDAERRRREGTLGGRLARRPERSAPS